MIRSGYALPLKCQVWSSGSDVVKQCKQGSNLKQGKKPANARGPGGHQANL